MSRPSSVFRRPRGRIPPRRVFGLSSQRSECWTTSSISAKRGSRSSRSARLRCVPPSRYSLSQKTTCATGQGTASETRQPSRDDRLHVFGRPSVCSLSRNHSFQVSGSSFRRRILSDRVRNGSFLPPIQCFRALDHSIRWPNPVVLASEPVVQFLGPLVLFSGTSGFVGWTTGFFPWNDWFRRLDEWFFCQNQWFHRLDEWFWGRDEWIPGQIHWASRGATLHSAAE